MEKEKLWTKDFISVTTISFFIFLAFYILLTALPLYLVGTLHTGAVQVGLMLTLFLIPAILVRPLAGQWVSKFSQKKLLVYSAGLFFIATLFYPFATNIWALFALRIFHGITFGIITTVKGTICAELIPVSRRGEGLSYFSMTMILAMVFGPFIGLNLGNINAYNLAFVICMAISAINIVFAVLMKEPQHSVEDKHLSKKQPFSFNDIIDKKAAPFALATFLLAFAYSGVSAFLSLYAKNLGLVSAASYFFIAYAVFILIFRLFTGRWSDKFGPKIIVYPSIVVFAIGLYLLS